VAGEKDGAPKGLVGVVATVCDAVWIAGFLEGGRPPDNVWRGRLATGGGGRDFSNGASIRASVCEVGRAELGRAVFFLFLFDFDFLGFSKLPSGVWALVAASGRAEKKKRISVRSRMRFFLGGCVCVSGFSQPRVGTVFCSMSGAWPGRLCLD